MAPSTTPHEPLPDDPNHCVPDCARCAELAGEIADEYDDDPGRFHVGIFGNESSPVPSSGTKQVNARIDRLEAEIERLRRRRP